MDESARPSRLSGLDGAMDRGRCVSGRSTVGPVRNRRSKSMSSSGMCTRGRKSPRSLALCCRTARGAVLAAGGPTWNTGSVLRVLSDGRLCSISDIEPSDERARDSLVRGRVGTVGASWGPDEPASCRPRRGKRRRIGFLLPDAGLEASCDNVASAGTRAPPGGGGDGRFISEGAHELGRVRRRGGGSEAPVELACPMVARPSAKKAAREKNRWAR
jgi:hypothetical protein